MLKDQSALVMELSRSSVRKRTDCCRYFNWHVKLVHHLKHSLVGGGYHAVFYVLCKQDALYSCCRNATTAKNKGQQWAVARVGVRRSSIYPVGAGKDPCISFLISSSNLLHLHIHVICQSQ